MSGTGLRSKTGERTGGGVTGASFLPPSDEAGTGSGVGTPLRHGGDLVIECLQALGATHLFGLPGQHALPLFDALHRSDLVYVGARTENNAAFAADAFARRTGSVAPLLVSTGPGALMTLPALQEAASASAPVLGISSQVPSDGLDGRTRGYWHQLTDQKASFRDIVKSVHLVRSAAQIPSALAAAWEAALTPPWGPTWVEIPVDVLTERTDVPFVSALPAVPRRPAPRPELVAEAARLLGGARRPVVLAGGGVVRAGAHQALRELAERIDAPVATTYGGKGAFPWAHPLSLRSHMEDPHVKEFLESADVLLVVGSGLSQDATQHFAFAPRGRLVHIDADLDVLGVNYPALALHADARTALEMLVAATPPRIDAGAAQAAAEVRISVDRRLDEQGLGMERGLLDAIRGALPAESPSFWDMTIMGYWAQAAFDPRGPGTMHSAQGACGLGYAFPAALGAAVADGTVPVLAVSGDGGAMYSLAELGTAAQHRLNVTWLIVDDGGYGILRQYTADGYGRAMPAHDLAQPDFVALAGAFGVDALVTDPDRLRADLTAALRSPGPSVLVLHARPRMFA
ncbi:thiamine pyrophosphate-binding protein [Streptomyces sp. NPDC094032]|uniref:thiamine pyrophosphate-binding protein n=1 Tax=Streptomyces sp. NPDC094032 TaxID=3155308 RepID=UPI0033303A02